MEAGLGRKFFVAAAVVVAVAVAPPPPPKRGVFFATKTALQGNGKPHGQLLRYKGVEIC